MKVKGGAATLKAASEYMGNYAEGKKFEGLANEIVDLLIAFADIDGTEQDSTKKTYAKPFMLEINQKQFKKFKNIIHVIHTLSDADNDSVNYMRSADGLDLYVVWKTSSIEVSQGDQSLQLLASVLNQADQMSITATATGEMTVKITLMNFMIKIDKGSGK